MPKSVSYHEHRIKFLKNPEAAAAYIEAILEEKDPEPELLRLALSHVAEALTSPEQTKQHLEKLDELLSKPGSEAIYGLGTWLNALGLKLTVTVSDQEKDKLTNSHSNVELNV
ncbi:MAG TPA: transcriptional regulator [Cyanobacteria bacterium UBA12227]|nr:transcriptional regulator [Cyanobacteria bacterium UBA12227]HAX89530.1 transcriptional regulator [Cyanobacteria bacterium UBA11370]